MSSNKVVVNYSMIWEVPDSKIREVLETLKRCGERQPLPKPSPSAIRIGKEGAIPRPLKGEKVVLNMGDFKSTPEMLKKYAEAKINPKFYGERDLLKEDMSGE